MTSDDLITRKDLKEFEEKLISEIEKLRGNSAEPQKWLRSKDVQRIMGISASSLQNLRVNRELSYSKVMGSIFYDFEDVKKLLEENKLRSE